MKRQEQTHVRPRGALRTPVSIRLEFAQWKALQEFQALGLMRADEGDTNDPHETRGHRP